MSKIDTAMLRNYKFNSIIIVMIKTGILSYLHPPIVSQNMLVSLIQKLFLLPTFNLIVCIKRMSLVEQKLSCMGSNAEKNLSKLLLSDLLPHYQTI